MEGNSSANQVYPVSCITGEGRAEFSRVWRAALGGRGVVEEGRWGRKQLHMCAETVNPIFDGDKSDGCGRNVYERTDQKMEK